MRRRKAPKSAPETRPHEASESTANHDADLGGGVIKQRVARQGQGRSGRFRTIIAFRSGDRSIFMYGFAKSRKADLTDDELLVYRRLAEIFLGADNAVLGRMLAAGELKEVDCDGQEER